ncbi:hypothetical protein K4H02_26475, partial [Mycobacterium tuberculosis]|nr:hypothetical protein [Mycobacterium tuberculosis]
NTPIPVIITIYADRSFTFEMRTPPMSHFLKQAAKIQSGSKAPGICGLPWPVTATVSRLSAGCAPHASIPRAPVAGRRGQSC